MSKEKNEEIETKTYKTILDLGMRVSLPFNNDLRLINRALPLKKYIDSFYLPPHFTIFPTSGGETIWKDYQSEAKYNELLLYIIPKLNRNNIKTKLILNATVYDFQEVVEKWPNARLFKNLRYLCNHSGLEHVIVADLPLAMQINHSFPHLKITISSNAFINNFERLSYWLERINNLEGVILDIKINKNLEIIKDIKRTSQLKITLIANEACLSNCPYREGHANAVAAGFKSELFHCSSRYRAKPWAVYKLPVVVPYNLRYYKGIVDCIKLYGRYYPTRTLLAHLNRYIFNINSRKYVINGWGITKEVIEEEPRGIFQKVATCNRHCSECSYCYSLWKKLDNVSDDYIYVIKGFDYQNKGKHKQALEEYGKVKNLKDKKYLVNFYLFKYACYKELKEYDKAAEALNQAIRLKPGEESNYIFLGSLYGQAKRNGKALEVYKKAQKIFPKSGDIYFGLTKLYFDLKRYKEAIETADKVIELRYERADMRFLLGSCYEKTKQYKKAIGELKKAQKITPQKAEINFLLARCYRKIARLKQSDQELGKGLRKCKPIEKADNHSPDWTRSELLEIRTKYNIK